MCVMDVATGEWFGLKTPTIPGDIAQGVVNAFDALKTRQVNLADIEYFVHGTTIAVNTIIQRRGADCALLVTDGFRDILELARLRMPSAWDYYSQRTQPLIPREHVIAVKERLLHTGDVETPLTPQAIEQAVEAVRRTGVASIAICLLHSYINPRHELELKAALHRDLPAVHVSCSAEIWPQMREYERATATVMNAYVLPIMADYIDSLETNLTGIGLSIKPYITRSNGGIMTIQAARREPVQTLMSGPASGVIGALQVGSESGYSELITFDMGGTSADVAVIEGGAAAYSKEEHVGDFPIIMPTVGISSIGAGGGSIGWIDATGVLRVGPESAGADPGPACYGMGGSQPALTDAFLVCGYLNPDKFAGKKKLDLTASEAALGKVAKALGGDVKVAAYAMVRVALANMYAELSGVFDRRGLDSRDFTLIAFGGAGPVVASFLAEEINVSRILVPLSPGTLCAYGALKADVMSDFIRSLKVRLDAPGFERLEQAVEALEDLGRTWLRREAPPVAETSLHLSADMRYVGQSFDLEVPLETAWIRDRQATVIQEAFHGHHERIYSHSDVAAPIEVVSVRLRAIGEVHQNRVPVANPMPRSSNGSRKTRLAVFGDKTMEATVVERTSLATGDLLAGPAIVEQADTTCVIPPGWTASVDSRRNLVLVRKAQAER
jgi:N-methylhydantoinase A